MNDTFYSKNSQQQTERLSTPKIISRGFNYQAMHGRSHLPWEYMKGNKVHKRLIE